MIARSVLWILSLSSIAASATLALQGRIVNLPPQWDPWAPLDVRAEPNLLSRHKLDRLSRDADRCLAVLRTTPLEFEALDDRETGPSCGFTDAVRVRSTPTEVGDAFSLTCRTALSLALWERHVVQPAARRHFGQAVRRFDHFGSYACRNVYDRPAATRSRHATAEAWDVAGFVLADGRRIRIARDWDGASPDAAFLREVRDGACRFFDGVLSPDYNAAHDDHLHLDRGPLRVCR